MVTAVVPKIPDKSGASIKSTRAVNVRSSPAEDATKVEGCRAFVGHGLQRRTRPRTNSAAAAVAAALVVVLPQSLRRLQNGVILRCPVLSKDAWIPSRACNAATPAALADSNRLAEITRCLTQCPGVELPLSLRTAGKGNDPQHANERTGRTVRQAKEPLPFHALVAEEFVVAEVPEDTHRSNTSEVSFAGDTAVSTACVALQSELQRSVLDALSNTLLAVDRKTRKMRCSGKRGGLPMAEDDSDFEDRMPELVDTLAQSKSLAFDGPNLEGITEDDSLHTQAEGLFKILEHRIGLSVMVPLLSMLQRSRSSGLTQGHVEKASSLLGVDNVHYFHLIVQLAQYIKRTNTLQRSKVFDCIARGNLSSASLPKKRKSATENK
ncbi:hypothetical protein DIPPA_35899 [Diplonema papillatum]|nr:hypothetical protein DIPPA_35899 [Diplonema papillatum]